MAGKNTTRPDDTNSSIIDSTDKSRVLSSDEIYKNKK